MVDISELGSVERDHLAARWTEAYNRTGHPDWAARVFRAVHEDLTAIAESVQRQLKPPLHADDLVSSFFIKLVEGKICSTTRIRSLFALARTTMRNDAMRHLRTETRLRGRHQEFQDALAPVGDPWRVNAEATDEVAIMKTWAILLSVAGDGMRLLRSRDRESLLMRYVDQLTCKEVARSIGLSANQGGMIVKRARDRFIHRVQDALEVSDTRRRLADMTYQVAKSQRSSEPTSGWRLWATHAPLPVSESLRQFDDVLSETPSRGGIPGRTAVVFGKSKGMDRPQSVVESLETLRVLEGDSNRFVIARSVADAREFGYRGMVRFLHSHMRGMRNRIVQCLALTNLSRTHLQHGHFEEAVSIAEQASLTAPKGHSCSLLPRYNRLSALMNQGRHERVRRDCARLRADANAGSLEWIDRVARNDVEVFVSRGLMTRSECMAVFGLKEAAP